MVFCILVLFGLRFVRFLAAMRFVLQACIYGFMSRCEERNNNALMHRAIWNDDRRAATHCLLRGGHFILRCISSVSSFQVIMLSALLLQPELRRLLT